MSWEVGTPGLIQQSFFVQRPGVGKLLTTVQPVAHNKHGNWGSDTKVLRTQRFSGAKRTHKTKKSHEQYQEFSEQFEGVTGSLPSQTSVLRPIAPESSSEHSAKCLSHSFSVVPFLSPSFKIVHRCGVLQG